MFSIKNKNILITGCSGYFGRQIVSSLQEKGAIIFCQVRDDTSKFIKEIKKKKNIFILKFDINNFEEVQSVEKKIKTLDVIINNAAVSYPDNLKQDDDFIYHQTLKTNFFSLINLLKIFKKKLIKKGKKTSSIINISSIYGLKVPNFDIYENSQNPNSFIYGLTKKNIIHFTKYYARYYANHNIRINSLVPGAFPQSKTLKKFVKFKRNLLSYIPMKRIGVPDDIISSIIYLSSDSSSYITGSSINIDGGFSCT